MKIIRPVAITESVLSASNVTEDDYPEWSAGTLSKGDRRILAAEHKVYEVVAATTTDDPLAGIAADPATWMEVGATNRWRMFDAKVGTQTSNAESVEVTIAPGAVINSLALFQLDAASVEVTMTDSSEGVVYSKTYPLTDNSEVVDWYAYFFEPIVRRNDLVIFDLPTYGTAELELSIRQPGGTAKVGMVVIGTQRELGISLQGSSFGITDYSRKERDTFGNAIVVERAYSKRASVLVAVETAKFDTVHKTLAQYRATPIVWAASTQYQSTILFGFYRDFDLVFSGPIYSDCNLEIEGLI